MLFKTDNYNHILIKLFVIVLSLFIRDISYAQTFEKITNSASYNLFVENNFLTISSDKGAIKYNLQKKNIEQSSFSDYSMIRVFKTDSHYFFVTYSKELLITNSDFSLLKKITFNSFIISVIHLNNSFIMSTSDGFLLYFDYKFNLLRKTKSNCDNNYLMYSNNYFLFTENKIVNLSNNSNYKLNSNILVNKVYEELNNKICLKTNDSIYVFDTKKEQFIFKYPYNKITNDVKFYNDYLIISNEYTNLFVVNSKTGKTYKNLQNIKVNSFFQNGGLSFISTDEGVYTSTDLFEENFSKVEFTNSPYFLEIKNDTSLIVFADNKISNLTPSTCKTYYNFDEKITNYRVYENTILFQSKFSSYTFNTNTEKIYKKRWGFRLNDFFKYKDGYVVKVNANYYLTDLELNTYDTTTQKPQNKTNLNITEKEKNIRSSNIYYNNLFVEEKPNYTILLHKTNHIVEDWTTKNNNLFYSSQRKIFHKDISILRNINKNYFPILNIYKISPTVTKTNSSNQNILIGVDFYDYQYYNTDYYYSLSKNNKIVSYDVKTSNNKLNLFLPEEGQYTLNVYTKGYYNNVSKSLSFTLTKPFYLKYPFWVILFLSLMLIGTYIFLKYNYQKSQNSILKYSLINSQIKSLQAAMNPHFLYNLLSILKVQVYKNQTNTVITTIDQLSALLRHNFESLNYTFVTIEKEINLIETYLNVESIRFNFHFNYSIIASSSINLNYYVIPNFILQPIIENYMVHAFKKNEPNYLSIRIQESENYILFKIYMNQSIELDFENIIKQNNDNSLNYIKKRLELLSSILKEEIHFGFNQSTSTFFYQIPKLTINEIEKLKF